MVQVKFIRAFIASPNNKHFPNKSIFSVDDMEEVSSDVADNLEKSGYVMILKMEKETVKATDEVPVKKKRTRAKKAS